MRRWHSWQVVIQRERKGEEKKSQLVVSVLVTRETSESFLLVCDTLSLSRGKKMKKGLSFLNKGKP